MVGIILVYCFYLLTGWQRGGALGFFVGSSFLEGVFYLMHLVLLSPIWFYIFLLILGVSPCFELLSVLMTADLLHGMGFFFLLPSILILSGHLVVMSVSLVQFNLLVP